MILAIVSSPVHAPVYASPRTDTTIVCPRYEVICEYLFITERLLIGLEQRAFLYMVDPNADDRYALSEGPDECVCMDELPRIVPALAGR